MKSLQIRQLAIGLMLSASALLLTFLSIEGAIALFWHPIEERVDSRSLGGAMTTGGATEWNRFVPGAKSVVVSPTAEFAVPYSINSLGLRDRERSWKKKTEANRIFVLGDSFAEGYGVLASESYPAVAESQAPDRWEWINGGMRGLSPGKAFFRLQSYLQIGLEIDLVLLQVHDNDLDDDRLYREEMGLEINSSGSLERRPSQGIERILQWAGPFEWRVSHTYLYRLLQAPDPSDIESTYELKYQEQYKEALVEAFRKYGLPALEFEPVDEHWWTVRFPSVPERILPAEAIGELWDVLRERRLKLSDPNVRTALDRLQRGLPRTPPELPEEPLPEDVLATYSYLDALLELTRSHDLPLLVYYQPRTDRLGLSPENSWFAHWSRERGVPFLSLRESLAVAVLESSEPLYFPIDGHLTAKGHEWVGVRLAKWTAEQLGLVL